MNRVVNGAVAGPACEAVRARRGCLQDHRRKVGIAALAQVTEPEMMEVDARHLHAEEAERVEVAMPLAAPAGELDAQLDRAVRGAQERIGVEPEVSVELQDRGHRRLADADGPDLLRFDQLDDVRLAVQRAGEGGGGHPPGAAAADDHDASDGGRAHAAGRARRASASACVSIPPTAAAVSRS